MEPPKCPSCGKPLNKIVGLSYVNVGYNFNPETGRYDIGWSDSDGGGYSCDECSEPVGGDTELDMEFSETFKVGLLSSLGDKLLGREGVYLITRDDRRTASGQRIEYAGKTNDFSRRLEEHKKSGRYDPKRDNVYQIRERSARERRDIEASLIQTY